MTADSGTACASLVHVQFNGDTIHAVREGERVWVSVKRMCELLGIADQAQATKLKDKPWATTTMVVAIAEDGKIRELFSIDLDSLPMWLATIEPGRVAEESRPKLIAYQKECARVLRDHFFGRRQAQPQPQSLPAPLEMRARTLVGLLMCAGVSNDMAATVTLREYSGELGVDYERVRRSMPGRVDAQAGMNATAVGERLGLGTGRTAAVKANKLLEAHGFQIKNERGEWVLTPAGAEHGEALPYASEGGRRTGHQLLWRDSVLASLRVSA